MSFPRNVLGRGRGGAGRSRPRLVIDGRPLIDDHFSGIGHYTVDLLRAVDVAAATRGIDVAVAVPASRADRVAALGFRSIRTRPLPIGYLALRRWTEAGRLPPMDLLAGTGVYFFPNYNRWPLRRSRSITAIHDLSFIDVPETVEGPNGEYLRRTVEESAARSDLITALTRTMASRIVDHYGLDDDRVRVVGCGVDRRRFYRRSDREVAEVTRRHGIFGNYLISVGNIEPRKNQVRLVEAFRELPEDLRDDLTLVLVGAGAWNEESIRRTIAGAVQDGCMIRLLLGQVGDEDLPALYSGAVASAYVSSYEGFGMPPLESAACATPVVCSNASVMPEVVGNSAILVDPLDVADISEGLRRAVLLDPARRADLVERGIANLDRHRWDAAAEVLLDAVEELS